MNAAPNDPMIGRLIDDRYQVRSRIARGGMATVYLATDLRLERRVAIKVMHGHLADDTNFKNRFVQEARSAARLAHPNVVNVFDQGQDSDMAYLVMEYLPGITLRELLKDYGELTPEQTFDIMDAVLSGLAAAHRAGIVHRDLKPENVLLADDGRIKLGDFGLARATTAQTGTGQALLGTIAYLSPELVTRGIADARSDIYALGIMMYEMLTGEQPFQGEQPMQIAYQHANDSVPEPSAKNPAVPDELDELVLWATARTPDDRPADAGAFLQRLREVERELGVDAPTASAPATDQATVVLGPAHPTVYGPSTADQTQILGPVASVRPEASATDAVAALATMSRRRRNRGWWLLALVLILAGAAAGSGWYFGQGPGSSVAIPDLVSAEPGAATTRLHDLGLGVDREPEFSQAVPVGQVTRTDPGAGGHLNRGATVKLLVSQGPAPITLPAIAGQSLDDARAAIRSAGARVGATTRYFDAAVERSVVIAASRASDDSDLSSGGDYFRGQKVNLAVSLGAVPDVTGKTLDEAVQTLDDVQLVGKQTTETYSDTVAAGSVVSAALPSDGPLPVGSTIALTVSKGPQLFPVPDVTNQTLDVAKQTLTTAGFQVKYPTTVGPIPVDQFSAAFIVTGQEPGSGAQVAKGTTVTLTITFGSG